MNAYSVKQTNIHAEYVLLMWCDMILEGIQYSTSAPNHSCPARLSWRISSGNLTQKSLLALSPGIHSSMIWLITFNTLSCRHRESDRDRDWINEWINVLNKIKGCQDKMYWMNRGVNKTNYVGDERPQTKRGSFDHDVSNYQTNCLENSEQGTGWKQLNRPMHRMVPLQPSISPQLNPIIPAVQTNCPAQWELIKSLCRWHVQQFEQWAFSLPPSLSRNSTTSLLLAPRSKIKKLNYRLYCSAVLPTPWPVPSAPTSPMLIWPLSCVLH